ncbi:MAG: thiol-disulfide isomerase [Acidobacteriia bacterium]|nr:thiol-disulfide isomerase [Terriglobia bacterium]
MSRFLPVAALGAAILTVSAMGAPSATPTFSKDVAPILYKNCAGCHRPGEIAPMSLLTYEQARPWAKSIRENVSRGVMPPWHAEAPHGTFSNDRRLTDADKNTLIAWADAGAPQGNPKDLPPSPKFTEGWEIGTPDVVLSMTKSYDVPASGTIAYQYFSIPTNFTEDKWVQAIEVRPGVRNVVHHILVFCREPKGSTHDTQAAFVPVLPKMPMMPRPGGGAAEGQQLGGGQGALIATTAPGTNAMVFEPGSAVKIPAGSTLMLQVHYTASGKAATDQSSVGLIFAKEPPQREIHNSAFVNILLRLPAGSSNQAVDSAIEFTENSHITALFPHTHLRGKSWEYRLIYPDGRSEVVLSVPKYDFNWQTYYTFAKPIAVPKGSRLEATAHYDNSVNNASNPDPKIEVHWGEQTWQEMQYTGITYYVDQPAAPVTTTAQK